MEKRDAHLHNGNDRYEGYAVDLIKEVADNLKFNFELYLVTDGKFGSRLPNGEWNGMVGELLAGVSLRPIYTRFPPCKIIQCLAFVSIYLYA